MGEKDEQMQENKEKTTKPCDGKRQKPSQTFFVNPKARAGLVESSQNSVIAIKPQAAQVTIFIYPSHFK